MRFVGGLAITLTVLVGILGLGVLAARAAVAQALVTWSWGIGTPILIGTVVATIGSALAAHLVNVLMNGIEGVLLDSHIDARERGPHRVKIGGALITVGGRNADSDVASGRPDAHEPLPLESPSTDSDPT